jgi:hypothetical protein
MIALPKEQDQKICLSILNEWRRQQLDGIVSSSSKPIVKQFLLAATFKVAYFHRNEQAKVLDLSLLK